MSTSVPELKRVLKLPTVAFIAIGFMIGGGVFVFTGIIDYHWRKRYLARSGIRIAVLIGEQL